MTGYEIILLKKGPIQSAMFFENFSGHAKSIFETYAVGYLLHLVLTDIWNYYNTITTVLSCMVSDHLVVGIPGLSPNTTALVTALVYTVQLPSYAILYKILLCKHMIIRDSRPSVHCPTVSHPSVLRSRVLRPTVFALVSKALLSSALASTAPPSPALVSNAPPSPALPFSFHLYLHLAHG